MNGAAYIMWRWVSFEALKRKSADTAARFLKADSLDHNRFIDMN